MSVISPVITPVICPVIQGLYGESRPPNYVSAGGPYQVVEGETVQLNGTAIFEDDPAPTYLWEIVSGGTGTFSPSATVEDPTFTPDSDGVYVLRLTGTGVPFGPLSDDTNLNSLVYVPVTFIGNFDPFDLTVDVEIMPRDASVGYDPGNVPPIVYTLTGTAWPPGLEIDANTGIVTGTPTVVALTSGHTITATDGKGTPAVSNTFDINVVALPVPIEFVGPDLGPYVVEIGDSLNVLAWQSFNGTELPITYTQAGTAYPNGISIDFNTGVLSGTFTGPTVNTTGSLVEANDAAANPPAFSNSIGFTVTAVNPTVDAGGPYTGDVDTPIAIDGASVTPGSDLSPDYLWTADLPGSFDDPTILSPTFTPTTEDSYTLTLTVTPAAGYGDPVADTAALTSGGGVVTLFEWKSQYDAAPETITNGAITFTAADARTAVDNAGYVVNVPAGASAPYGQRTAVSFVSNDYTTWATIGGATLDAAGNITFGASSDTVRQNISIDFSGKTILGSIEIRASGADIGKDVRLYLQDGTNFGSTNAIVATLTGDWVRYAYNEFDLSGLDTSVMRFCVQNGSTETANALQIQNAMLEDVSSHTDKTIPSTFTDLDTVYNDFTAGVQNFNGPNANTVDGSGVVTDNPTGPAYTSGFYCDAQGGWGISHMAGYSNLCLHSEDFSQVEWIKAGLTVGTTDNASPRGDSTATKLIATVASEIKVFGESFTLLDIAKNYTHTIYVKETEFRYVQILGSVAGFGNGFVNYDLQTGSVTNSLTGTSNIVSTALTPAADGWLRLTVSFIPLQATADVYFGPLETGLEGRAPVYTGNGTDGMLFWGGMMNEGNFAAPYAKTDAAASIIGDESCTITDTGNVENTAGTVSAEVYSFWASNDTGDDNYVVGTNANGRYLFAAIGTNSITIICDDGPNRITVFDLAADYSAAPEQVTVTWEGSTIDMFIGSASNTGSYDGDWAPGTLGLGNRGNLTSHWNGLIRFVTIKNAAEPPS